MKEQRVAEIKEEQRDGLDRISIFINGDLCASYGIHEGRFSVNYHYQLAELVELGYVLKFR